MSLYPRKYSESYIIRYNVARLEKGERRLNAALWLQTRANNNLHNDAIILRIYYLDLFSVELQQRHVFMRKFKSNLRFIDKVNDGLIIILLARTA